MGITHWRPEEAEQGQPTERKMADTLDMELRDPQVLNVHTKVLFDEVLGEPEGVRSIDCTWRNSFKCFNGALSCCYKFLTVLCGLPLAFCWGCEFACTACYHVFYWTPMIRDTAIWCKGIEAMNRVCIEACCSPCMASLGRCLSMIRMKEGSAATVTTTTTRKVVRTVKTIVEVEENKPPSPKSASPAPQVHGDDVEETEAERKMREENRTAI